MAVLSCFFVFIGYLFSCKLPVIFSNGTFAVGKVKRIQSSLLKKYSKVWTRTYHHRLRKFVWSILEVKFSWRNCLECFEKTSLPVKVFISYLLCPEKASTSIKNYHGDSWDKTDIPSTWVFVARVGSYRMLTVILQNPESREHSIFEVWGIRSELAGF